jgi:hypothetical protein
VAVRGVGTRDCFDSHRPKTLNHRTLKNQKKDKPQNLKNYEKPKTTILPPQAENANPALTNAALWLLSWTMLRHILMKAGFSLQPRKLYGTAHEAHLDEGRILSATQEVVRHSA